MRLSFLGTGAACGVPLWGCDCPACTRAVRVKAHRRAPCCALPVHAPPDSEGCADLYKNPGILDFQRLRKFEPLHLDALTVTPVPLIHSKPTLALDLSGWAGI